MSTKERQPSVEQMERHGRRSRRFTAGRVCESPGCGTHLSIYNGGTKCALHGAGPIRTRGRR